MRQAVSAVPNPLGFKICSIPIYRMYDHHFLHEIREEDRKDRKFK